MTARRMTIERITSSLRRSLGWPRGVTVGHRTWLHSTVRCDSDGVEIGDQCRLLRGVVLKGPDVVIGDRVFCNDGVYIDRSVTVEDDVRLGHFVRVITSTHEIGTPANRAGQTATQPVVIGSGSWLGAGVTVLPGVRIGTGCVVAAGAVVTEDCLPHGLYAGIPAKRKRDLPT